MSNRNHHSIFGEFTSSILEKVKEYVGSGELSITVVPDIKHDHESRNGRSCDKVSGSVLVRITFSGKEKRTLEK